MNWSSYRGPLTLESQGQGLQLRLWVPIVVLVTVLVATLLPWPRAAVSPSVTEEPAGEGL